MNHVAAGRGEADLAKLMTCDVSRAYPYAPAVRPVYVKIAEEDREPGAEGTCGKLNVSMCGTRDAAFILAPALQRTVGTHWTPTRESHILRLPQSRQKFQAPCARR